ncbi:MAG: fatty acid desaturase [Ferruginibacter sp.]
MEIILTDPMNLKQGKLNFLDRFFIPLLNDKRDMAFIYLSLKITFTIIPFAIILFVIPGLHWAFYVVYLIILLVFFLGPYVLMLHNVCHRKLFKKKFSFLNKYIPWVLGIFFGQTPETYFYHHVTMHHPENNEPEDLSSTMKYKRDSIRAFLLYLGSFYLTGVLNLALYFKNKQKNKYALRVIRGESFFMLLSLLLCFYNFYATLAVFILPLVFIRFAMMAGNWAQHAFINAEKPEDIYGNSITCINTIYNQKCFNDGYHIGHHLRPFMHWTEMPVNFKENITTYSKNNAIVFSGLDYFQIWFLLMTKNYKKLAANFVDLREKRTADEIVNFLKSRTRKI